MVYSRETAARRAEASKTNEVGMCQLWTRNQFGAPSAGDQDKDKDYDAIDGWKSCNLKHPGDRNPPRGVPVYFDKRFGHAAVSLGGGKIRSTDMDGPNYRKGHVGTTTIAQIEKAMDHSYLGWTEDVSGIPIPKSVKAPTPPEVPVQESSFILDLSHYQFDKGLTLAMVWKQGYRHIILKCTQGTTYFDPTYEATLAVAKDIGFSVSVYHFLEQGAASMQAQNLAQHILDKGLPVWIDVEPYPLKKSKPKLNDWVGFRDEAKRLGLKVVGKYLGESYWEEIGKPSLDGPLALWRPAYPSTKLDYAKNLYPGNAHERWNSFGGQKPILWQFARSAKIDGYSGGVDVSAFRGTHAELDKTGFFKKLTKASAPKPTPTPVPVPKPDAKSKDFVVHLVPGNKFSKGDKIAKIKADMALVKKKTGGGSGVVFNTERDTVDFRQAVADGLGSKWKTYFKNENIIGLGSNWSDVEAPKMVVLSKKDPSMKGVSPTRVLNELIEENKYLADVPIAFCGTHWTSEANCVHKNAKGRAWREKVWPIQLDDTLDELERIHNLGIPIVFAGDLNTGIYFDGKKVMDEFKARFGKMVSHVYNGSLDHIFIISTDKVKLSEVGVEVKTDNSSDHDMVTATIRATVL